MNKSTVRYLNTYQLRSQEKDDEAAKNITRNYSHSLSEEPKTLSAGQKHSKAPLPLTLWRAKDRHFSRLETQQGTTATHSLESQGQALSAG